MIPPELTAVVDRARMAGEPSLEDEKRIRAMLAARLGATSLEAPPPAITVSPGGWRVKALLGLAAMVGAGTLFHAVPLDLPSLTANTPAAQAIEVAPHQSHAAIPQTLLWEVGPDTKVMADDAEPTPKVAARASAAPAIPAKHPIEATHDQEGTVAEELRILLRAHAALNTGDAPGALAVLDEHARRFPRGVLSEERLSQRVIALQAAGRTDEARVEGDRFLREHPVSPFTGRVREALLITNP